MELITRCPACEIAFHVTNDHLQLAGGKVRCGACLSIFDARSHIEVDTQQPNSSTTSEGVEREPLIYDDMESAAISAVTEPTDALEEEPEQPAEPQAEPVHSLSPSPLSLPPKPIPQLLTHEPTEDSEQVIELSCDNDGSIITLGCDNSDGDEVDVNTNLPPDTTNDDSPFVTPVHKRKRRPFSAIACVLAVLLLPAQYIYFHIEQLAVDPQYHRWLSSACQIIGCQVPPLSDPTKIIPTKLVVISHPTQSNALLVEAVIENRASFAQPLPTLLLTFSNILGATVAERRFQPQDYLHGELAGATLFPPHRPVRIQLELADPGENATNYQLLVTE